MTYQEANHISIKDYLKSLGILPACLLYTSDAADEL